MGIVGDIVGGILGSRAAGKAADVQAQTSKEALDFAKQVWGQEQENIAPFLEAGKGAVTTLSSLVQPGGELVQPWTKEFTPPTVTEDPGYQFRLEEGQKALERSAAARGGLTTGGTLKATERYAQGLASQEYGAAYDRRLREYQMAYDIFKQNQSDVFNKYASLSGIGQTATEQLGKQGTAAVSQQGGFLGDIGAARATGYYGAANAWLNAISNANKSASQLVGAFV